MQTLKALLGTTAFCLVTTLVSAQKEGKGDQILGEWKAKEKVLTIQIYKQGAVYNAKIISFTDHHNPMPSDQRQDDKNPDPALRKRKMIGMNVLSDLTYSDGDGKWTKGKIYDAGSGKTYSVNAELSSNGELSVRAYKGITLLGKTLTFHR